jgi:hypothetical protein
MSEALTDVIKAAADLKRAAPAAYDRYIECMQHYATRAAKDVVVAGKDGIFQAQGRAQTLEELAKKLEACLTLDEKFRQRT